MMARKEVEPEASPHPARLRAPIGTQHKIPRQPLRKATPAHPSSDPSVEEARRAEELKTLPERIKTSFKTWTHGAKPFQLRAMEAQVLRKDVLIQAATGAGKTGIAAGPHLLECNAGKATLVISPLIALHEEQVSTFKEEFGLRAIAINSAHGGCSKSQMKRISQGQWQVVILSPEMLQSRRFTEGVLRSREFGPRCLSVFIDEAHCVSHWGASFRKKYGTIGIIRAFLPRSTPFVAVSATLTPRVRRDVISKLQYDPANYLFIDLGNERPAVSQIVRAIEHPLNTYADLDFVVPQDVQVITNIPKTFLYTDDIPGGSAIVDYLNARVPESFRNFGLIRPYNAAMSSKYRKNAMTLFKAGIIRVLVSTDAAGMGCNISDVDMVVQWKTPTSLSSWFQRAGRAARGDGRTGLAVLLVEKSSFAVSPNPASVDTTPVPNPRGRRGARGGRGGRAGWGQQGGHANRGQARPRKSLEDKAYAIEHGQKRGDSSGKQDARPQTRLAPTLSDDSLGEGLYAYIQTTDCRRKIMRQAFGTSVCSLAESDVPSAPCCDLCNEELFDMVRGGQPPKVTRKPRTVKKHDIDIEVRDHLYEWRRQIKKLCYP
ncbi:P-loop containing nucleoside triphosphate hydrolase protein [Amylostereum chailletii]|nr:P-loop containing nucleoside triphosphate hydrolase protein [Amylostereum chailletii]